MYRKSSNWPPLELAPTLEQKVFNKPPLELAPTLEHNVFPNPPVISPHCYHVDFCRLNYPLVLYREKPNNLTI